MADLVLLTRQQINDTYWNTLIDESPHPVVYAYSWYLDIVSPHWQALVVASKTGYEQVMPLPVKYKWGFRVIQQPFFCQYLGIYARDEVSKPIVEAFLGQLNRHFRYISTYAFHPENSAALAAYLTGQSEITYQRQYTQWLLLGKTIEEIREGYSNDRKNNLRKAGSYAWEVISSEDVEPLIGLFCQNHQQQIPGGVAGSAYDLLRRLSKVLASKKVLRVYYAQLNEELRAGIMLLEHKGTGIYIFNAADTLGRKGNARTWLLHRYFAEKGSSLRYFDFETPPMATIAQFYASFGPQERIFYAIQKNKLPFPLRQLQNWRKRLLRST
ncbi:MAG: GNAT family N-acetyltransferase [Bacteroidetes bacterium]|nr:GNAT family N-acetyltransferase [Bacteroidota bacterium]